MATAMVDDLLAAVGRAGDFYRPNYFDVTIPGKGINTLDHSFMVLSCSVPSRAVQVGEYSPSTPTRKFVHGVQDEDVSIVFRLTNDFVLYDICLDWVEQVANPKLYYKSYKKEVAHDTHIKLLDRKHNVSKEFKLINSFPINISNIELSNESTGQVATFGITLTYDYFERMN